MSVALIVIATACGSSGGGDPGATDVQAESSTDGGELGQGPDQDDGETTGEQGSTGEAATIDPGGLATGDVTIDGQVVDYVTVTPEGFERGDTAPVMLAFQPGGQDAGLTESVVDGIYRAEALARGWVVVSPAAPRDGSSWFGGAEVLAPGLMDWIEDWVSPEGGGFHIVGVSSGGLSSFRVAGELPDRVRSVLVFPGYPRSDTDREGLGELVDVPVRMFVGAEDTTWIPAMEDAEATLVELGGDVELEVLPGEGHIIGSLGDGVRIFDELEAAR